MFAKLINENDDSIKLIIDSKVECFKTFKTFKRIVYNKVNTDFIKCINWENIIKCNRSTGSNGAKRHKCAQKCTQITESIVRHLYKPSTNETKIKSDLTDTIVMFIAKDMRPYNVINGKGFKLLGKKLLEIGSKYPNIPLDNILVTSNTVSNHTMIIYNKMKAKLIDLLKSTDTIAITCDHWTHEVTHNNYITVTIQYIIECEIVKSFGNNWHPGQDTKYY